QTLTFELRYPPQWKLVTPNPLKMRLAAQPQNPPIAVTVKNTAATANQTPNNTPPNTTPPPPNEAETEARLIENLRSLRKFDRVADKFNSGLLLIYNGGKYFYLNRSGNPAFPGVYYDQATDFTNGNAQVTLNGKTYYIDRTGKCVRDCNTPRTNTQQTEQPQQNRANLCQNINCGAYGYCNPQTGECICTNGYTGNRCQNPPK
ncbi:MAG TPA: WG repeat-containing protein, partial [Chitinophagales bacterium]|nr:WG repeat-containing protein [Chitinophagales bacterium]